jgi:hypothetical protein
MSLEFNINDHFEIIKIAVLIAIILGVVTSIFFMITETDSYSAIYIVPNSIIRNFDDNSVIYAYGVKSSETGTMDYTLETFANTTLIKSKQFSLKPSEILDERDKIILQPDFQYPLKISLKLTTKTATEEVHFWLK